MRRSWTATSTGVASSAVSRPRSDSGLVPTMTFSSVAGPCASGSTALRQPAAVGRDDLELGRAEAELHPVQGEPTGFPRGGELGPLDHAPQHAEGRRDRPGRRERLGDVELVRVLAVDPEVTLRRVDLETALGPDQRDLLAALPHLAQDREEAHRRHRDDAVLLDDGVGKRIRSETSRSFASMRTPSALVARIATHSRMRLGLLAAATAEACPTASSNGRVGIVSLMGVSDLSRFRRCPRALRGKCDGEFGRREGSSSSPYSEGLSGCGDDETVDRPIHNPRKELRQSTGGADDPRSRGRDCTNHGVHAPANSGLFEGSRRPPGAARRAPSQSIPRTPPTLPEKRTARLRNIWGRRGGEPPRGDGLEKSCRSDGNSFAVKRLAGFLGLGRNASSVSRGSGSGRAAATRPLRSGRRRRPIARGDGPSSAPPGRETRPPSRRLRRCASSRRGRWCGLGRRSTSPISSSESRVSSRARYMTIWRGSEIVFVRFFERRSVTLTP